MSQFIALIATGLPAAGGLNFGGTASRTAGSESFPGFGKQDNGGCCGKQDPQSDILRMLFGMLATLLMGRLGGQSGGQDGFGNQRAFGGQNPFADGSPLAGGDFPWDGGQRNNSGQNRRRGGGWDSSNGGVNRGGNVPPGQLGDMVRAAANKHGIPADLFHRLVQAESGGRNGAVSGAGAAGLTQLMPATARGLGLRVGGGVDERFDPQKNLDAGARYLKQQFNRFGNWRQALAAYNAGPGNVLNGRWTSFRETTNYVRKILGGTSYS